MLGISLAAGIMVGGRAAAQSVLPYQTPPVSPYLSLFRQGTPPAVSYFNIVRPQIDFNSSINNLQQQVGFNRQAIGDLQQGGMRTNSPLPPTGFVPSFQNYRGYFLTYSGGGLAAGGLGGGQIPNRATGGGNPRAMGVPALGSPSSGGIGGIPGGALPAAGGGMGGLPIR
jgi:hypothetical protein